MAVDDYKFLRAANRQCKSLLTSYLQTFVSCELRCRASVDIKWLVAVLEQATSVAVLDLSKLKSKKMTPEIMYNIQRIVQGSRNRLVTLMLPGKTEPMAICPFLSKCSHLRICNGLRLSDGPTAIEQVTALLKGCSTIASLSVTLAEQCAFERFAQMIVTALPDLCSLTIRAASLGGHEMVTALPHLAKLSSLTALEMRGSDFRPSFDKPTYQALGPILQAFPALKSLVIVDGGGFGDVTWTLAPTVERCCNHSCSVRFNAKQMRVLKCDVYGNDVAFLCAEPMPRLTDLNIWWLGNDYLEANGLRSPPLDRDLLLRFDAPALASFYTQKLAPELLPMVTRMTTLRFLDLKLEEVISHRDVAHFLRLMPLIEEMRVTLYEDGVRMQAYDIHVSPCVRCSKMEKKHLAPIRVPQLRILQFISHGKALTPMLLSIDAPRLALLMVDTISNARIDTPAIMRHFSWLTHADIGANTLSLRKKREEEERKEEQKEEQTAHLAAANGGGPQQNVI